jgi:Uma2 family endonuclease
MVTTRLYTAEDLWEMPTDFPWELWEGVLRKVPGAGMMASGLGGWIGVQITLFVRPRDLGLVTGADGAFIFQRNPDTVVIPDVAFTKWENIPGGEAPVWYFPGHPDLAVEVKSPTDPDLNIGEKVRLYRNARVPLVWWVYPDDRVVEFYRLGVLVASLREGDVLAGEDVLPGFTLPVSEIFQ